MDIARALIAGGVPAIEVTMSTPKAIAGIEKLADELGDKAVVGVGTVIDAATVPRRDRGRGAVRRLARRSTRRDHRDDQALREDQHPRRVHADGNPPRLDGRARTS